MAKYDVKFSCGHTETISLIGPVAERERKIKYFEDYGVCSECYKKQKEAEREKQNAENAKKAADYGMAELEGSEKQVAWANTIRVELLEAVQSSRADEILRLKQLTGLADLYKGKDFSKSWEPGEITEKDITGEEASC